MVGEHPKCFFVFPPEHSGVDMAVAAKFTEEPKEPRCLNNKTVGFGFLFVRLIYLLQRRVWCVRRCPCWPLPFWSVRRGPLRPDILSLLPIPSFSRELSRGMNEKTEAPNADTTAALGARRSPLSSLTSLTVRLSDS